MSFPNYKPDYISEQNYLEDEKIREIKHEYFDGEIFAMAGASRSHQRLTTNTLVAIANHLKDTPCEAFSSDMKVRADNGKKYFYPDVVVSCTKGDGDSHFEDEWFWAAAEMYCSNPKIDYQKIMEENEKEINRQVPSWNQVAMLGYYTLLRKQKNISVTSIKIIINYFQADVYVHCN